MEDAPGNDADDPGTVNQSSGSGADDELAPYGLNYDELRCCNFTNVHRLDGKFTNGLLIDLLDKLLGPLNKADFFEFLKHFVDEATSLILDSLSFSQFEGKLNRFITKKNSLRKTRSKFIEFCKEPFVFSVSLKSASNVATEDLPVPDTPVKKKLKKDVIRLQSKERQLVSDNIRLSEKLHETDSRKRLLEETAVVRDTENLILQERIEESTESLATLEAELVASKNHTKALQKKIAGLKSGKARLKTASTPSALTSPIGSPLASSHDYPLGSPVGSPLGSPVGSPLGSPVGSPLGSPVGSPLGSPVDPSLQSTSNKTTKLHECVLNAIRNEKEIIVVDNRTDNILQGKRYTSDSSSRTITTGKSKTYIEIEQNLKPCTEVSDRETHRRTKLLDVMTGFASSGSVDDQIKLLTKYVRCKKSIFKVVVQNAGFQLQTKMLPSHGIQLQSLLRLSTYSFRNLRRALTNLEMNILPSEGEMAKEKAPLVSHVSRENVESGTMALFKTQSDTEPVPCGYVRVNSLYEFVEHIIIREVSGFSHVDQFNNKWWILFSGDKGGSHMKFHLEIVNSNKSGSVDNVHLYCLFEATDSPDNMKKVWFHFRSQVKTMMQPEFMIQGRAVQVFLGGDYHFLDDMLGHQGSSASYPSHLDYVPLIHLKEHGGLPHTPDTCEVPLRTLTEYSDYYNANLADTRRDGDLRDKGKFYYSVIDQMIFPINDLGCVVPASLHILLGITLLLYNKLLFVCMSLDAADTDIVDEEKESLDNEYEIASLEVVRHQSNLRGLAVDVVTMMNRVNRLRAVMNDDHEENEVIARMGCGERESRKKKKKKVTVEEVEKCCIGEEDDRQLCFVTAADKNVNMVQCDACDQWYHAMCDAVVPSEEATLSDNDYTCTRCSAEGNVVDRCSVFETKVAHLIEEEELVNTKLVDAERQADEMRIKYISLAGEKEKSLIEALEAMKVQRQAYHGNVLVGNHSIKVLKRHTDLTKIIEGHPTEPHFNEVFSIFNDAMKLMMARRFLTDDEIEQLCQLCHKFGEVFPIYFPEKLFGRDSCITRKIHELVFNVPIFVKRHRTLGLLSEQEGESKHSSVKAELRSLASVRNHGDRIRLVMEKEELRSCVNKSIVAPKPRLCKVCPGRVFLRAGNDKLKHCTVCEPEFFSHS